MIYENGVGYSAGRNTEEARLLLVGHVKGVSRWVAVRGPRAIPKKERWGFCFFGTAREYLIRYH